jgi:hypothetical protein
MDVLRCGFMNLHRRLLKRSPVIVISVSVNKFLFPPQKKKDTSFSYFFLIFLCSYKRIKLTQNLEIWYVMRIFLFCCNGKVCFQRLVKKYILKEKLNPVNMYIDQRYLNQQLISYSKWNTFIIQQTKGKRMASIRW